MEIQASYCNGGAHDGAKMIGMFGCGDPNGTWKVVETIDLNGSAPVWGEIEKVA